MNFQVLRLHESGAILKIAGDIASAKGILSLFDYMIHIMLKHNITHSLNRL